MQNDASSVFWVAQCPSYKQSASPGQIWPILHSATYFTLLLSTTYTNWGLTGRKRRLSATRRNAWSEGMLYRDSVSLTPLIQVFQGRPLALWPLNLVLYDTVPHWEKRCRSNLLSPLFTMTDRKQSRPSADPHNTRLLGWQPLERYRYDSARKRSQGLPHLRQTSSTWQRWHCSCRVVLFAVSRSVC